MGLRAEGKSRRAESEPCATTLDYHTFVSRLRRPFVAERIFFVTNNLLRTRWRLADLDFEALGRAMAGVRARRRCLLTGYVFMPDQWRICFEWPTGG